MTIPPRIPVTGDDIDRVVAAFYAQARAHRVLGPVFADHISNWPEHEAKISRFWRNALLHERGYDGNPMQVHAATGSVKHAHFPQWLAIFDAVLHHELRPQTAQAWSALAHRIGRGLQSGLPADHTHPARVPHLG